MLNGLNLSARARALYQPGMTRRQFVDRLFQAGLLEDAAGIFGALLTCHAVWWACLSVWKLLGPSRKPDQRDGLRVAARWSVNPSEENRKAAETLVAEADYTDPVAWVVLAAARAGSAASVDSHPDPVDAGAVRRAAEAAVRLAVAALPAEQHEEALRQVIRLGYAIAEGGCPRLVVEA
ncbi:MAG: hypothetical protein AB7K24_06915 [Gemmataceae bacterium]